MHCCAAVVLLLYCCCIAAGLPCHLSRRYMQLLGLAAMPLLVQRRRGGGGTPSESGEADAGAAAGAGGGAFRRQQAWEQEAEGPAEQPQQQAGAEQLEVDGGEQASPQAAKADREGEGNGEVPASGGPAAAAAAAAAQQPGVQLAPRVLEARQEGLKAHWEGLKQQIQVGGWMGGWGGEWVQLAQLVLPANAWCPPQHEFSFSLILSICPLQPAKFAH